AAQQQEASQAPLEQAKDAPPDTGAVPEKPVTPLEPAQPGDVTTEINAAQAAPKPKTSGEIEEPIQEEAQSLDEQMAEAEVTEEQLANSNEPSFNEALASKQEAKESAASSPPEYRQAEQTQLQTAQLAAENEAATQLQGMHDSRTGLFDQVAGQQNETVSADEQKRAEIAAQINTIYEETKTRVDGILSTLDEEVASTFSAGAEAAKAAFENFVDAKMEAYKEERYGGMFGWAKWAKDKLLGMPSEVNA
ncbi:MAG: hypothetical protein KDE28_23160, partial [Anaerolineales bacterium]|nr:hypothetical protein [Anaerolineales bacterium]